MNDIKTEHITLTELKPQDLPFFHELTSDERVGTYMRFGTAHSLKESEDILSSFLKESLACGIWEKDTMVGVFAYKHTDEAGTYDISVFFSPSVWNKGYFSEVLAVMMPYAKKHLHAKKLKGFILENNAASCHVAEKFGFQHSTSFTPGEDDLVLRVYEYIVASS